MKRILIAGLGNIFHGDDAFGVEVVRELSKRPSRAGVNVVDFGIRAYDLAYALTDGYDAAILVDAAPRGQQPGTVYLIEPDLQRLDEADDGMVDAHALNPAFVLKMAHSLGGPLPNVFLIGCEPAVLECEGGELGLSERVRAAVPGALSLIDDLLNDLLAETQHKTAGVVPA